MCDTGDIKIGENHQESGNNIRFAVTLSPTVTTKKNIGKNRQRIEQ